MSLKVVLSPCRPPKAKEHLLDEVEGTRCFHGQSF